MHIEIDYDGTMAICTLSECLPCVQDPQTDPFKTYNFNDAPKFSQIYALDAFRTIEEHWKREQKNNVHDSIESQNNAIKQLDYIIWNIINCKKEGEK